MYRIRDFSHMRVTKNIHSVSVNFIMILQSSQTMICWRSIHCNLIRNIQASTRDEETLRLLPQSYLVDVGMRVMQLLSESSSKFPFHLFDAYSSIVNQILFLTSLNSHNCIFRLPRCCNTIDALKIYILD